MAGRPAVPLPSASVDVPREAATTPALAWALALLDQTGRPATGAPELVKTRPWSTVHRVPVDGGVVWVKASGGGTGYEAPLSTALAGWVPELVLTPIAADDRHGRLLLPDGGTPLRERPDGTDPAVWNRFLREYAGLQRAVVPHAAELVALGVPDQSPERLPRLLDGLLDDVPLDDETRSAVLRLRPAFADACAELAAGAGGPQGVVTVQHDDLHAGNVLPASSSGVPPTRAPGRPPGAAPTPAPGPPDRFFDWGDAAVAHPFTTLLVTLRSMAASQGLPPDDPALLAARDAYLSGWEVEGPEGVRLARLAAWTGCVGRALAWRRALADSSDDAAAGWSDAVPGWVGELAEPSPAWFADGRPRG